RARPPARRGHALLPADPRPRARGGAPAPRRHPDDADLREDRRRDDRRRHRRLVRPPAGRAQPKLRRVIAPHLPRLALTLNVANSLMKASQGRYQRLSVTTAFSSRNLSAARCGECGRTTSSAVVPRLTRSPYSTARAKNAAAR